MSRELPRQPRRVISAPGRGAHPLLRDPPDLRGRGQGAPDAAGLPLLPLAARPAHLPGDLGLHDLVALDHQHATSRTPTPSVIAACTSSWATRTCRKWP